ncbi:HR-like lesion-inducing protein-related [Raphanus sativus]|uniref:Uncharacterized protein LOC108836777 n=1 Tax=Raphanus sativus TaxID=3726 RepID=A0A9W3BYK2_RAPSA|nr:uncharacterized protein LOC130495495 [Raphanus sativus]XP_056844310.1 uncharacterized protein LOC108836777 [Raphanus sativus]KAJ4887174.1 HR-like lesion-inducing protein-related [Raphanus sativus]KAJ4887212.1 HR-like lesion-inducing protein-related [Raphanus sativus]
MDFVQRKVNNLGSKVATFPYVETIGRALFSSSFFFSAWHDYMELSSNWEGAEDYWRPKFGYSGDQIKHLMAISIIVKTLGGLIFIYGSFFGAFLLLLHQGIITMIHHDFYSHRVDIEQFGLLYLKFKRILNETVSYETVNNFYKSNFDEQHVENVISKFRELTDQAATNSSLFGHNEFVQHLLSFIKGLAVVGALLFFLTMKHKLNKAKKESKVKTD